MASDIVIRANELLRVRSRLNDLYVSHIRAGRKLRSLQHNNNNHNNNNNNKEEGAAAVHPAMKVATAASTTTTTTTNGEVGAEEETDTNGSGKSELDSDSTDTLLQEIEEIMDRDTFMTAEQALDFGLIDQILIKREKDLDDDDSQAYVNH
eukprot:CAMPEP_0170869896 /NCGR_PEP_ID=MMETSP0734-20130129/24687_1 /TAXON_ID=186038 /ORGANISM="Fragilariopsis kerguelensis, Strain L26-C5" /LENGTH=150 /DNA_ID=CAMNT_0011248465 /DNA_START=1 /DNA_END=453 /DNA_ORIENTATION=-